MPRNRRFAPTVDVLQQENGLLEVVGDPVYVECLDGLERRCVGLDTAATAPALKRVQAAVEEFLPWYGSVHRGAGLKSRVSTAAFEGARVAVADFVAARPDDLVIFVRGTTEAINLLSLTLPANSKVLSTPAEHHANMLPWRRHQVELLPFTNSTDELLQATQAALQAAKGTIRLIAITGASNVTGEIYPIAELAQIAHANGAEIFVDAAQLAPHRPIDIAAADIDYLALSGHKLYAPYGAGALIARPQLFEHEAPLLHGGGAIASVTLDAVSWAPCPARWEAGTPNVVGAIALGVACDTLTKIGMESITQNEQQLADYLFTELESLEGVKVLLQWEDNTDRVGVASFVHSTYESRLLATILSLEYAIAVRSGQFCAHPLLSYLLCAEAQRSRAAQANDDLLVARTSAGAVRVSLGIGTTRADLDCLIAALQEIFSESKQANYRFDESDKIWCPINSPEPELPSLICRLEPVRRRYKE